MDVSVQGHRLRAGAVLTPTLTLDEICSGCRLDHHLSRHCQ